MKSVSHPLGDRKRRRYMKRWKIWGVVFLFLLLISGLIYLIFFSNFFRLKNIEVSGFSEKSEIIRQRAQLYLSDQSFGHLWPNFVSRYLKQKSTLDRTFLGFNDQNILFLDDAKFVTLITNDYPDLKDISVSLNWTTKKLEIKAQERQSALIWCLKIKNDCYYLDQDGIIFALAPQTTGYLITSVLDESDTMVELTNKVLDKEKVSFLKNTVDLLTKNDLEVKYFEVKGFLPDTVKIYFSSWYAHVSFSNQPEQILSMIQNLKTEKIKNDFPYLEYMDLRYPDRAYYKLK